MHTAIYVKHCFISQQNIQLKKLLMITVGKYNKKRENCLGTLHLTIYKII